MALVLADRVKETTTTTGTGTVTLLGASTGFQSFAAVGNANTTYYTITAQTGTEWEVGIGTYTSSGTTLSRTTVLSSSNGGSLVDFTAGTKDVFVTYPSSRSVYADGTTLTATNSSVLPIASGGTNSTATATAGGIGYGTGTAHAYTSAGSSGQVVTSAGAGAPTFTTATNANTASAIVQRDASGNFSAGTITAALSGNATTATSATTATTATQVSNSLTLATSGTGLSGSASFNGASAQTFTVTSNATNANTVSTIVARDASGNFSAGTITAALNGNASTATSATTATTAGSITSQANSATITASTAATANQIVLRDASGYAYAVFFNGTGTFPVTASANTSGMGTFTGTNGSDNFGRGYTAAAAATLLSGQTMNINGSSTSCSGNAATATTATTANATATGNNFQMNSLGVGTAGSGTAGEIRATNNVTAYYSDDRLKTRLGNIEGALDKVKTLDTFYYEANETAQALGYEAVREVGISAQQVQAIMPETVAPAPIDDQYLTVRYERLVPLLLAAIKELEAKVAALEAKG